MHLIGEQKAILGVLMLTVFYFFVMLFIPLMGNADKVGEIFTLPRCRRPGGGGRCALGAAVAGAGGKAPS